MINELILLILKS